MIKRFKESEYVIGVYTDEVSSADSSRQTRRLNL